MTDFIFHIKMKVRQSCNKDNDGMIFKFFADIANNIGLLLALCFSYRFIARYWKMNTFSGKILAGLLFGGVASVGMFFPVVYSPGLVFDGRTIVLGIIGLFGGILPMTIAVGMTSLLRIWQGGVGMWMGLGTIISSALIGVLYRYLRAQYPAMKTALHFYFFGIVIHSSMLVCAMLLPDSIKWDVLSNIAIPVMVIYPIATMIYCLLMEELDEREKMDRALQENEAKLKALLSHSFLFVGLLTLDGRVLHVNKRALEFIGQVEELVIGQFFWETPWWSNREQEQNLVRNAVIEAASGNFIRHEMICFSPMGEEQIHDFSIKPILNEQGQSVFLIAEGWDISQGKKMEEELRQKTIALQNIAYSDMLTGLPNRVYLEKHLGEEMQKADQEGAGGSLFIINLDDLRMINDSFSHSYGDHIIRMISKLLVKVVGEKAFVARNIGDEFIVVLPRETNRDHITKMADRIIMNLNTEHLVSGVSISTSVSAGIAMYPEDGSTVEEILKNAVNALYVAKKSGKNCWFFYEESMESQTYENVILTNRLRHAAEYGELSLHYQPQVGTESGKILGFEALLRWNSEEWGAISPARFIPIAEQSGLIRSLGQWVLEEACQFAKKLDEMGYGHIYIAVNVSPRQLTDGDFVKVIRQVLDGSGIKANQLELEITENVLLVSLEEVICKLELLQKMGVRLSLDDFGTGYSSLRYLQRLPVNTLKIDKSFIDMIKIGENQPAVIGSIIHMAHIFKMTVVAEGVERQEQLDYLRENSCDCIQGYFFSRPVAEGDAVELLKKKNLTVEK